MLYELLTSSPWQFPHIVALRRGGSAMTNAPFLAGTQALFGAGLLHHELHKRLKGQGCSMQPFEWDGFEQLGASDDEPRTLFGRQMQGDALASQGLPDIVV